MSCCGCCVDLKFGSPQSLSDLGGQGTGTGPDATIHKPSVENKGNEVVASPLAFPNNQAQVLNVSYRGDFAVGCAIVC